MQVEVDRAKAVHRAKPANLVSRANPVNPVKESVLNGVHGMIGARAQNAQPKPAVTQARVFWQMAIRKNRLTVRMPVRLKMPHRQTMVKTANHHARNAVAIVMVVSAVHVVSAANVPHLTDSRLWTVFHPVKISRPHQNQCHWKQLASPFQRPLLQTWPLCSPLQKSLKRPLRRQ